MMQDNLIELKKPEAEFQDPLAEILRKGARQLPAQALEAEVSLFMEQFAETTDEKGRKRVVRTGYLPEREVQTGIGPVAARVPRVRDREKEHAGKVRFDSTILPPYPRKTRSMEQLIPWLCLKGISTGDFTDVLASLLGLDARRPVAGNPATAGLKSAWQGEYDQWQKRDLSHKRYVHFWADSLVGWDSVYRRTAGRRAAV